MVCKVWPSAAGLMAISQHLIKQLIPDLLKALLVAGHDAGLSDVLHGNSSIEIGTYSIKMLAIGNATKQNTKTLHFKIMIPYMINDN